MQAVEHPNERAADLYWLAYLLTGQSEPSLDVTIEALNSQDQAKPFFSTWMAAWSRKVVIAKALAAIRGALSESARRTASNQAEKPALSPRTWVLDPHTTKAQLQRALLAIDLFPRCAVLLSIFERVSLEDAAVLLDSDVKLVRKGRTAGLRELTGNLARMQGWIPDADPGFLAASEMQHA